MKKPCLLCKREVDSSELSRCQSQKHRHQGDAYCQLCVRQHGSGFHSPFYCNECHPEKIAKGPASRAKAPKALIAKAKAKKDPRKSVNDRLRRLRKALGMFQSSMSILMGISPRNYQDWEYGTKPMSESAKMLAYHIASKFAPEVAKDWPEGMIHDSKPSDEAMRMVSEKKGRVSR